MFSSEDKHMYNNYFIANQIYSRSKYTSNYTRDVMSNTTGRMQEMRYYIQRIQLQEQLEEKPRETLRKYETRELDPKIDHKIFSTDDQKERYSKNNKI